jgi:5-formaminoimidazole-4-carboxamide-1-(beta)-D-ribofuranosyl 5'-monophosphate synthetase
VYVEEVLREYELDMLTIATLASHSSLQIVHGAKTEGFRIALVVLRDRYWFYSQFSRLVDRFVVDSWSELCTERVVSELRKLNAIFIPHGSYIEYVGLDCAASLPLPIFGLRSLYRVEADQWAKISLLREAGILEPRVYKAGDSFKGVVIAKLPGAKGADLLPALKGGGSPAPLWAAHRFPPSIRVYICHLGGSEGGQNSPRNCFDPQYLQSLLPYV